MVDVHAVMIAEYERQLEPVCVEIAQQTSALELFKTMKSTEKAGERDAVVAGQPAKVSVTAKEAIANCQEFLKKAIEHKDILIKLIAGENEAQANAQKKQG